MNLRLFFSTIEQSMNTRRKKQGWFTRFRERFFARPDELGELRETIQEAQKKGVISIDSQMMIEGALQVAEMQVRDIMVPRSHVVAIHEDMSVEEMLAIAANSGHSRFPVIDESIDQVVGILLAKDLTNYHDEESRKSFELKDILRPAVYVPESKRLNVLLKDFRESRNHMAIVIDEYSGVAGLVTIEDVIEEIVGEIDDEHDAADITNIHRAGLKLYSVRGLTPLDEFNQYFSSKLTHDKFETIGGYVTHELGHLPERGEEVDIAPFHFKVISANSRRINTMQVRLISPDAAGDSEDTQAQQEARAADSA
jgi:magnesium and cobalt transporter